MSQKNNTNVMVLRFDITLLTDSLWTIIQLQNRKNKKKEEEGRKKEKEEEKEEKQ